MLKIHCLVENTECKSLVWLCHLVYEVSQMQNMEENGRFYHIKSDQVGKYMCHMVYKN